MVWWFLFGYACLRNYGPLCQKVRLSASGDSEILVGIEPCATARAMSKRRQRVIRAEKDLSSLKANAEVRPSSGVPSPAKPSGCHVHQYSSRQIASTIARPGTQCSRILSPLVRSALANNCQISGSTPIANNWRALWKLVRYSVPPRWPE